MCTTSSMLTAVLRRFTPSHLFLIGTAIATSTLSITFSAQPDSVFSQAAIAQDLPQSKSVLQQPAPANQLGGIVRVDCTAVQFMPVPPTDGKGVAWRGGSVYDLTMLREAEALVNSVATSPIAISNLQWAFLSTEFRTEWQVGETIPEFRMTFPVNP